MNNGKESSVQLIWWIQKIILHIKIHSALHKKCLILIRVPFNYSDESLSSKLRFVVDYTKNEWL